MKMLMSLAKLVLSPTSHDSPRGAKFYYDPEHVSWLNCLRQLAARKIYGFVPLAQGLSGCEHEVGSSG